MPLISELNKDILERMNQTSSDPLAFVMYSFPWGKGELAGYDGPENWQKDILEDVRKGLITFQQAILIATSSGHGVGKSALVAWLILWSIATFPDTRGIVTANTDTQLRTKTWPELNKWFNLFIARHWFTITATSLYSVLSDHEKTWRFDMIPWSEQRTEAFAGLHNKGKRVVVVFDESSAIADKIWEVTEGALTDENTQILWVVFGNPTRNSGRFHSCFHRLKHRWNNHQVDSRSVKLTNKNQLNQWIQDYGEDSDFVKVRIKGEFPSTSDLQFIPTSYVEGARGRFLREDQYNFAAKIIGVDGAWTGECAIYLRQGNMSRKLAILRDIQDDLVIAGTVARFEDDLQADAVFIDLGYGTGIASAGKQMKRNWQLIPFGGASTDPGYLNKRADMWRLMKAWLKDGGSIEDDPILAEELVSPQHYEKMIGPQAGKIFLESKDDMIKRGVGSPNRADALCLTFAMPVKNKSQRQFDHLSGMSRKYDPLALNISSPNSQNYNPLSPLSKV